MRPSRFKVCVKVLLCGVRFIHAHYLPSVLSTAGVIPLAETEVYGK